MSGSLHFWCGQPTWGCLITLPPVIEFVGAGMLLIGCLCSSTLLWVAKLPLDRYLLAFLTFFCHLGSRNVGEILV